MIPYFYAMKIKGAIKLMFLLCFIPAFLNAQEHEAKHKIEMEIPEVALLGIVSNDNTTINLNSTLPTEAGNALTFDKAQNTSVWLNYSSVVTSKDNKRKVVGMVQGELPAGIKLMVEASDFSGKGKGKFGEPAGYIQLTNQPKDIIVGIGSCYTGKGANNGHVLSYKIETDNTADNYTSLTRQQNAVNVIYTLTDYN